VTATRREDLEPVEPEGWQGVTDDALATWAIDKLAHYTRERDRIRRNAQAYIEQIQADAAADEKPLADKIQWFTGQLVDYYHSLDNPPKTYKLPNGTIAMRAGRASTKVTDVEVFIDWAKTNAPDAVKLSPLVSGLPDWERVDGRIITPDGEPVPGVEVVTGEPSVTVKPAGRPE